jgi:outer membrane receptor protein involved in Fe transport
MWLPTPRSSFRLGASTAYRSPTLLEEYQRTIIAGGEVQLLGNTGLKSEKSLVYEAGYRGELLKNMYLDISYALKRYQGLIAQQETASDAGVEYHYVNDEGGDATARTFEAGLQARPADWLAISVVYGHVDISVDGPLAAAQYTEQSQPSDFGALTVGTRLPGGVTADTALRYTASFGEVDAYWRLDVRLAKTFRLAGGDLEAGVVGQNLLDPVHVETVNGKEIPRTWYGYLSLTF